MDPTLHAPTTTMATSPKAVDCATITVRRFLPRTSTALLMATLDTFNGIDDVIRTIILMTSYVQSY